MKRLILSSLVLALAALPAAATTFVMVSDESLVQQADLIVRARIDSVDPQSATAEARTTVRAVVDEVLKGDDPGEAVRLSILGGTNASGMSLKIWGAPQFREGEEVILFLSQRRGGSYTPLHLFLGAFHEIDAGGHRLAVRSFGEARQITLDGSAPAPEPIRDADRFVDWIRARVSAVEAAPDYFVKDEDGGIRSRVDAFTLLRDPGDNFGIRWKVFNPAGGKVHWRMQSGGQSGVGGGGFTQFQNALNAWKADPSTAIDLPYDGTTTNTHGLTVYDTVNAIIFNDPNDEVDPAFSCASGGVLAQGGPWYDGTVTHVFQGQTYHEALNADIVFNNNTSCFYTSSGSPQKAFEEVAAHELGHTLGLGHSCGDSKSPACGSSATLNDALMRANVHNDGRGGQLGSDDTAGIFVLYGSGAGSPPAAPSNLLGGAITHTAAQVSWTDNSNNETNFHVEVKIGGGSFNDIGTVSANSTGAIINGLPASSSISVRVRAQGAGGFSGYSNTVTFNTPGTTGACIQDGDTICLLSGRFKVEMIWRSPPGFPNFLSANRAPAGTANAGIFFFTDPNDWQVLLKVINACGLTNTYWVFYAATTNVQFQITITDRVSGVVKLYNNAQGVAAPPVQDTSAFATCP